MKKDVIKFVRVRNFSEILTIDMILFGLNQYISALLNDIIMKNSILKNDINEVKTNLYKDEITNKPILKVEVYVNVK